jgi:hypothetical protein
MEDAGIFLGTLSILRPFGIFFGYSIFFPFWYVVPRKILHPWTDVGYLILYLRI